MDEENLVLSGGYLKLEPTLLTDGQCIPLDLIDGGVHMDDFDKKTRGLIVEIVKKKKQSSCQGRFSMNIFRIKE